MKLRLYGGFGEKGRTSLGIESASTRLIIDAGINTNAPRDAEWERAYYPAISPADLATADALIITHAHEDHLGGLGWSLRHGFRGRILMTAETRADMPGCLRDYAEPGDVARALAAPISLITPGEAFAVGDLTISTGRNGHVVGGLWCLVEGEGQRALYCGDVVPKSSVFAYDVPPPADVVLLDASYGDDDVPSAARAAAVVDWVAAHPRCLLPVPLAGRSLEMLALLEQPLALATGLRDSLEAQIADPRWLWPGLQAGLVARLEQAIDWTDGEDWPDRPLMTHDAMGMGGPAAEQLPRAVRDGLPILLTGHVPTASPAYALREAGVADWLRLPTHPTVSENAGIAAVSGARRTFGHSCDRAGLAAMAGRLPTLDVHARTGDVIIL
ncbi:MBL fold metallo-hydrolase [Chelatococcus asaccharovorans]|uniref:MBL fold metallo-hydrolase n=1 Tax=Chelatococcus asaccharovorans TaxID=28210 RepID=UPI00224C701A|nr:MBL fold metallo-hydrolase [Chelatococcus asaccharovorans]CAH1668422.1 Lactamase_B domain-containing protein [Chelatococcus asaccharovorans]CAH1680108.1 Lactamase_B domain-containing protein [Chelatococcus asaccharovorans]